MVKYLLCIVASLSFYFSFFPSLSFLCSIFTPSNVFESRQASLSQWVIGENTSEQSSLTMEKRLQSKSIQKKKRKKERKKEKKAMRLQGEGVDRNWEDYMSKATELLEATELGKSLL